MTQNDESSSKVMPANQNESGIHTLVTLIGKIKNPKDNEAWTRFYKRYNSFIRGTAINSWRKHCPLMTSADIEDVVMKVFESIANKADEFVYDPNRGKYRNHLATIAIRHCINLQRHRDCRPGYNPPRDDLPGYKLEPNRKQSKRQSGSASGNPKDQTPDEVKASQKKTEKARQQEIIYSEVFAEHTGEIFLIIKAHDLEVGRTLALEKLRANNDKITKRTFQIFEMLTLGNPIADVCTKLGVTPNQVAITRHKVLPLYETALREAKAELDSPGEFPPSLNV